MIEVTRLGAHGEAVWVNPDLIATMEAHPDTVVVLTTGTKLVVSESVDEVVDRVRDWRASVARSALNPRAERSESLAKNLKPNEVGPTTLA